MKTSLYTAGLLASLLLSACGAEDPSFVTQSLGRYMVEVEETGTRSEVKPYESTYSIEEESIDAMTTEDDSLLVLDDSSVDTGTPNSGMVDKASEKAKNPGKGKAASEKAADKARAADAVAEKGSGSGGTADDGGESSSGSGSVEPGRGAPDDDSNPPPATETDADKALAKACAPHFRGIGSKIRVLSVDRPNESVTISADTVIAFHLRGNMDRIELNLGASQGIAGVCLILTGNQAVAQVNSASSFQKLVYVGRGNQSQGQISMLDGASIASTHIEMSGNQPQLELRGVAPETCKSAKVKGNAGSLSCNP